VYLYDELRSDEAKEKALVWAQQHYFGRLDVFWHAVEERMRVKRDQFYEDGSVA
jgi:hypothetical protein